jgi:hypothetical protein
MSPEPSERFNRKRFFLFVAATLSGLALLVIIAPLTKPLERGALRIPVSGGFPNASVDLSPVADFQDQFYGSESRRKPTAKLSILLLTDLSCPSCRTSELATRQAVDRIKDNPDISFKVVPITVSSRPNSVVAARFVACAEQPNTSNLRMALLERQGEWSGLGQSDAIKYFYRQLDPKADQQKVQACLSNPLVEQRLTNNQTLFKKMGLNATPTYLFGNFKHVGSLNEQSLEAIVNYFQVVRQ